jgi:hypothetical protein
MTLAARWMKPHSGDHPITAAPSARPIPGGLKNKSIIHYEMSTAVGRNQRCSRAFESNRIYNNLTSMD